MKRLLRRITGRKRKKGKEPDIPRYDQDHLRTAHNHDFMRDPRFVKAYQRGVQASGSDYGWHWRVHTGLWAATTASKLAGDFVECGVGHGFMASAILDSLDWNASQTQRHFHLFDTFTGLQDRHLTDEEIQRKGDAETQNAIYRNAGVYAEGVEAVRRNFEEWERVHIIEGAVPDTLHSAEIDQVAFLHLDMNCCAPEIAALEHFWPRLVPGGIVLLDDYAYLGCELQKEAIDKAAAKLGHPVLSLPTGQGMILNT